MTSHESADIFQSEFEVSLAEASKFRYTALERQQQKSTTARTQKQTHVHKHAVSPQITFHYFKSLSNIYIYILNTSAETGSS